MRRGDCTLGLGKVLKVQYEVLDLTKNGTFVLPKPEHKRETLSQERQNNSFFHHIRIIFSYFPSTIESLSRGVDDTKT